MINLDIDEGSVIRDISPNDLMLDTVHHYYRCGRAAIGSIMDSLQAASKPTTEVRRILDLPCGHGRVLRYLKVAFPHAEISACDLLRDAVDFCASTFGAVPVYSSPDPEQIPLEQNAFDLIWAGSLFTHLDSDMWMKFLNVFRSYLRAGGLLVFSTQGHQTYHLMTSNTAASGAFGISYWRKTSVLYKYERTGFGFVKYANTDGERGKYPGSEGYWGVSLSHPSWVIRQVRRVSGMRIVHFSEKGWDRSQDVFACIRDPDWEVESRCTSTLTYMRHKVLDGLNPRLASILVALRFGRCQKSA